YRRDARAGKVISADPAGRGADVQVVADAVKSPGVLEQADAGFAHMLRRRRSDTERTGREKVSTGDSGAVAQIQRQRFGVCAARLDKRAVARIADVFCAVADEYAGATERVKAAAGTAGSQD